MALVLENEGGTTLPHHKAIPPGVEWPRGPGGLTVSARQRPRLSEGGYTESGDCRLGSPGHDHIGGATPNPLSPVSDGVGRGGTGSDRARDRAEEVVLDRRQTRGHVGDDPGNAGGADPIRPPPDENLYLVYERPHSTEAGTHHHPGPGCGFVVLFEGK